MLSAQFVGAQHAWFEQDSLKLNAGNADRMNRLYAMPSVAIILVTGLAACGHAAAGTHTPPKVAYVGMVDRSGGDPFGYTPRTVTVRKGVRVVWRNRSSQPHTVTQTGEHPVLDSGSRTLIAPRHEWSFVFRRPGTYTYTCLLHPFMKGTIIVSR